jgi:hypothetical protein
VIETIKDIDTLGLQPWAIEVMERFALVSGIEDVVSVCVMRGEDQAYCLYLAENKWIFLVRIWSGSARMEKAAEAA